MTTKNTPVAANTTNQLDSYGKMELYGILAGLFHKSVDSVAQEFARYDMNVTDQISRDAFIMKNIRGFLESVSSNDGEILENSIDLRRKLALFSADDVVILAQNILGYAISRPTVNSHFVAIGLSFLDYQDIAFYLELCYASVIQNENAKNRGVTTDPFSPIKIYHKIYGSNPITDAKPIDRSLVVTKSSEDMSIGMRKTKDGGEQVTE